MDALNVLLFYLNKLSQWNLNGSIVEIISKPCENYVYLVYKLKEKTCHIAFSDVTEHVYRYVVELDTGYRGYVNLNDNGSSTYELASVIIK